MSLAAEGLLKIYRNGAKEVRAVNGVSLEVKKGEAIAVVGPSGAGKSTLLHMLGGLDSPTEGRVLVDGADIYKLSDRGRAGIRNKKISFVFQFYHLLPEFTALENVMMPWLIGSGFQVPGSRDGKKWMRERAREVLRLVGLEERTDHRPGELSGGESQRVAVARALMNTPEVLLCDEPTGNLDSKTSDSVLELLTGLKSKEGMALVIVTHNEAVSSIADRTLHMRDGRIS